MLRISRYTIRFTQFNYQFNLYLAMPHCYCIIYIFIWYLWYTYILYIIFFFTKHLLKKTEMFFFWVSGHFLPDSRKVPDLHTQTNKSFSFLTGVDFLVTFMSHQYSFFSVWEHWKERERMTGKEPQQIKGKGKEGGKT